MGKIVGRVSEEEVKEIREIFGRKNALENLIKIVNPNENNQLYEKLIYDYNEILQKFQMWWSEKGDYYAWEGCEDGVWNIDFLTGDIYLEI